MDNLDPIYTEELKGNLDDYLTGKYGDTNLLALASDVISPGDEPTDIHDVRAPSASFV